ncbi:high affinity copper uptake protein 1 isoform X1 [Drosophila virilis]|uniref:high affinity copper uptake protein 1 isoform X1 n=1 Tax=Drosophila virilis TaxID=7244 RepID=UPI001395D461|nr:high affinity copper uptake protein 1 isoform X1 [Drosophila virilis]XP_032296215.1 high affinity copper uptake protein 1 isoform X1 [Drosophila virilis]XP_032296216.1 high affinity copper uptake protein 1 isoform X1 [Drosophila virilis]
MDAHAHHSAPNVASIAQTELIDHSMHGHDHANMHHDHEHMGLDATTLSPPLATPHGDLAMGMHAGHHHGGGGGGGTGTGMEHMMSMAFHFGYNETILFSWWHIETVAGLIGSMIAIFLLALLYEGLKYYREYLFWKTYNLLEYRPVTGPQRNPEAPRLPTPAAHAAPSPVQYVGEVVHKQPPTMLSINHLYQTLLHVLQVTLSFLLMLIFMTYNVWLCMMVVLGAGVGYFLFCWKKSVIVDVTEHCH